MQIDIGKDGPMLDITGKVMAEDSLVEIYKEVLLQQGLELRFEMNLAQPAYGQWAYLARVEDKNAHHS